MRHLLIAIALLASACHPPNSVTDPAGAHTSAVEIRAEATPDIFPSHWRLPHIDARADPIDPAELERAQPIIAHALAQYPPELLDHDLHAIYLVSRLTFFGIRAAGTSSNQHVYLAIRSSQEGFTATFIEGVFHHEFSSILLRNYADSFPHERWYSLLPEGFSYLSSVRAIRLQRDAQQLDERYFHDGFIHQYAMASAEEDFNAIAQNLFLPDPDFWNAVDHHDVIRAKTHIVIDFYNAIHPAFTEDWFRNQLSQ